MTDMLQIPFIHWCEERATLPDVRFHLYFVQAADHLEIGMAVDELRFRAERVEADQDEFTADYAVHTIYFGEGDIEQSGQHWNFQRCLTDDEDDGVCTVKEPQEVTVYGGIISGTLTRQRFMCEFDEETAQFTGVRRLTIEFEIDDETWEALVAEGALVFQGEDYFEITP